MKKTLLFVIAIIQLTAIYGQKINFEKSFEDAKAKAARENKPIFILFTAPPPKAAPGAHFDSGIEEKTVIDFYNENFVCYQVVFTDTASNAVKKIINPRIFPTYIFLDSKAQLLYKGSINSIDPQKYLGMAQEALNRILGGRTLSYYADLDKKGTINADQLKGYIRLKEELELYDNAALIDEYVDFLSVKALNDYYEVLFIMQAGPYYRGKAYGLCYTNPKVLDSIYKHEPLKVRVDINTRISANTLNEAIRTKNVNMAQNLSSLITNSYGKDYREGYKHSMNNMLMYYKGIKDTANYYWQGMNYYDSYLNINADSAKRLEAVALENIKESIAGRNGKFSTPVPQGTVVITSQVVGNEAPNTVAAALNHGAWDFYLMGTHNVTYLIKAFIWCRRAIELQPIYPYYDTMAHIMYNLNFYDEAQLNQQKAIDMAITLSASKQETDHLKAELDKMKERKL